MIYELSGMALATGISKEDVRAIHRWLAAKPCSTDGGKSMLWRAYSRMKEKELGTCKLKGYPRE